MKYKFVWRVTQEWKTFNRRFKSFESETEFECKILKIIFIQYRFQAAFMLIFNIRELSLTFQSSMSSMLWDWINTLFHFTYFTQTWELNIGAYVTFYGSYQPIKNRDSILLILPISHLILERKFSYSELSLLRLDTTAREQAPSQNSYEQNWLTCSEPVLFPHLLRLYIFIAFFCQSLELNTSICRGVA